MPSPTRDISSVAADQRALNARRMTGALGILMAIALPLSYLLGGNTQILLLVAATVLGLGVAHLLVRTGYVTAGTLTSVICVLVQQVGTVAANGGELSSLPYISSMVVLLVAACSPSRWLWPALGLALAALALEGFLSPWAPADQGTVVTAALYAVLIFILSLLHVRGTERAFRIAAARERARAEAMKAARESDRLYRLIADNTDDLIALVSSGGHALYLSPSHERVLGVDTRELLGRRIRDYLNFENFSEGEQAFGAALSEGESHVELLVRTSSGELHRLDSQMTRVDAEGDVMVAMISRDVTERLALDERLVASERLEALGRLAGSVAHDFNNLLTVMGGATELAKELLPPDHEASQELEAVLGAANTASRLTQQLLTFSRHQLTVPVALDLKDALEGQLELLQRMVGKKVLLSYDLAEELPLVRMPSTHFEQLAMNVAVNARDAMPNGGSLVFGLRLVSLKAGEHGVSTTGQYVQFFVSDTGLGISKDALPRLFEPSFTTKRTGTGLGLATCHGVVTRMGGGVSVETEQGKGTTFRFFLPASAELRKAEEATAVSRSIRDILVVDDEVSLRNMTARMLQARGLQVRTAGTLQEARGIIEDPAVSVDALVTDVVLSRERGTDLLDSWRTHRPNAPIVVMSGYAPDASAASLLESHRAEFLPKPFRAEQLLAALGVSARS